MSNKNQVRQKIEVEAWTPRQDALKKPRDASYDMQAKRPPMTDDERASAEVIIGRKVRGDDTATAVYCAWGLPAVQRVSPALPDGTPFPTTFWLACPVAASKISTLEGTGEMAHLNERLAGDPEFAERYEEAAKNYVEFRDSLGPKVPSGMAAGGMPERVKCLHALYGHYLATGDNPVGEWVAQQIEPLTCKAPCAPLLDKSIDR